ncbi:hypothetical protein EON63_23155 [archaeon]|nr:MAG: hypothetical protein EON63_23155 [archaeon]
MVKLHLRNGKALLKLAHYTEAEACFKRILDYVPLGGLPKDMVMGMSAGVWYGVWLWCMLYIVVYGAWYCVNAVREFFLDIWRMCRVCNSFIPIYISVFERIHIH